MLVAMKSLLPTMLIIALLPSVAAPVQQAPGPPPLPPDNAHENGYSLLVRCEAAASTDRASLTPKQIDEGLRCLEYISGFTEAIDVASEIALLSAGEHPGGKGASPEVFNAALRPYLTVSSNIGFCPSGPVPLGQLAMVLVKWLKDHPNELHKRAGYLAIRAFREAFPCPK